MNVTCSAPVCPVILNSSCVFYEGESLVYTGINTNDSLQVALQKIDAALGVTTVVNIYNSDGVLTGNRTVSMNSFSLSFEKDVYVHGVRVGRGGGSIGTNTVVGDSSLVNNTTGTFNTAVGIGALDNNTVGNYNTGIGAYSLTNVSSGEGNTGVGTSSMTFLTTGYSNTALGYGALYNATTGFQNIGVGRSSLYNLTSGSENIGIGLSTGSSITTGIRNTIVGHISGQSLSTGNSNTIIGANVSGLAPTTSNNIILSDGDGNIQFKDDGANTILPRLAGAGTRMVVADVSGALSSQAIPTPGITGTGAAGQVTYWTGASAVSGSNNLFWDNAQGRLGVGTNTPTAKLEVTNNEAVGVGGTSYGELINASQTASGASGGAVKYGLRIVGSGLFDRNVGTEVYGLNVPAYSGSVYADRIIGARIENRVSIGTYNPINNSAVTNPLLNIGNNTDYTTYNNNPNSIYLRLSSTTPNLTAGIYASQSITNVQAGIFFTRAPINGAGHIDFVNANDNVAGTLNMRLVSTGNLMLKNGGTFTDAGQRLQVYGDTLLRGSGNTNTTTALTVQNSDSLNILRIRNDASFFLGNASSGFPAITGDATSPTQSIVYRVGGNGHTFQYITSVRLTIEQFGSIFTNANNSSTGIRTGILSTSTFNPTSGTAEYNSLQLNTTINQVGANGITRGLYVNPTLTAAADFRAIETSAGGAYINTTAVNASAILQADSTTKGFLPPRMTLAQKNLISTPAEGLIVYQTDGTKGLYLYDGASWRAITII